MFRTVCIGALAALAASHAAGALDAEQPVISEAKVERATAVKDRHIARLMALPAVVGAGIGMSSHQPGDAAIIVYVERELKSRERRKFPKELEGVPVEIYVSGPIKERPRKSPKR